MPAKNDQQLPLLVEDLHPVLHAVGNPDMTVAVDRHSLRSRKIARTVAVLAIGQDELSVGIEHLNAIIQRVAYIKIAISINRQSGRLREISGRSQFVIVPGGPDLTQQLE